LEADPPFGICAWPKGDRLDHLEAQMQGPENSPYENGIFTLDIVVPERYPFEPPKVKFLTKIYHPNIDDGGRICLDTLKMEPKGAWTPSLNVSTVLTTIRLLLEEPNGEDGLMPDVTEVFKQNRPKFFATAKEWTKKYASEGLQKPNEAMTQNATSATSEHEATKHTTASSSTVKLEAGKGEEGGSEPAQEVPRSLSPDNHSSDDSEEYSSGSSDGEDEPRSSKRQKL